jgi:hypothetical protein
MAQRARIGVYPGSFDPLTVAHVAIADGAVAQLGLTRLDLVLSRRPLAKDHGGHAALDERIAAIEAIAADGRPWITARVTELQLLADVADGYEVCIVGADKWHQLVDVAFYDGSAMARDAAVARMPLVAVVPRDGSPLPEDGAAVVLDVAREHRAVSSTAVRAGRDEWRAR